MNKYTMFQLAHFNRCLFPVDFCRELHEIGGLDETECKLLEWTFKMKLKSGEKLDVLTIYQEYGLNSNSDEFTQALEKVLDEFVKRYYK